ncbi:pyridoxamine 5'-phosphate oxidase family protein [Maribacter sp. TH_r10]|uniref:Pyridoxamine 5'-phosphate oxidase n=1 Tax=Maribacter luteus TaxID=2594478 RepID=A0A6I2MNZ2_9FLAO|nr:MULTISPECIES: pyridoxamine 5'-phosphate oxidase family protein [Maribacter]MDV7139394.1 pyridoxamine 5'-phosphate oxidase family protein [Maribacter sp. TH_r10]MRX65563.1 pyridoxamine 5'-phosphate oxidase [Maribacter luteus]|tara:strand:- start:2835 stop:3377 length:543 start_codon:yes stop_codon:yes gene_type:complete
MQSIFEEILSELQNGAKDREHPYHYFTIATLGVDKFARLRLVALRNVSNDLKLTFFTDKRSKKVLHIKENPRVSLLFYHPEKLLQLRIEGMATINSDQFQIQKTWETIGNEARKDYLTTEAPGTTITNPESVEYLKDGDYFSIVDIEPFRIERLKLNTEGHRKTKFNKKGDKWTSEHLVP